MSSLQQAPKEVYNLYLQTGSNIITHIDDSEQNKLLEELTDMVQTSCMLDSKLKQSCEILKRLSAPQENYDGDQEALDYKETLEEWKLGSIIEQFKNEIAGIDTDVLRNKTLLDFKQQIKVLLDDAKRKTKPDAEDDELVMTQSEMNVIDPITKKRIIDPVKNTACGHVYDRESVVALLQGNKKTRCPVVGCANKNYILLENLRTDILTKRYLDRNVE